ncbi:MAG: 4-(cytidine 5'-diphospho)-2-C-methyl-D-erythritol kinase [Sporolactobacillus sp.]
MKIFEKAPAKINLSLDITGCRPDGYHEVRMVMATIDLADRIECEPTVNDGIVLHASVPYIPEDARNLIYQAADRIKKQYGIREGVKLSVVKQIPVAAGLAGGSSDAAATIRALNRLWKLGMTRQNMYDLAAQIGSDVPFCIEGGVALATGRGEKVQRLSALPPCWVVVVKPNVSVSTAQVYREWDEQEAVSHPDVDAMLKAVDSCDFQAICNALGNTLEPVTTGRVPEISRIKEHLQQLGAEGILMSGSGPTVFALTQRESRAQRLLNGIKGYCHEVYAVRPCHVIAPLSKYE